MATLSRPCAFLTSRPQPDLRFHNPEASSNYTDTLLGRDSVLHAGCVAADRELGRRSGAAQRRVCIKVKSGEEIDDDVDRLTLGGVC